MGILFPSFLSSGRGVWGLFLYIYYCQHTCTWILSIRETPWCFVSSECMLTFPWEHSTFHTDLLLKPELGVPFPHWPLLVCSPSWPGPETEPSRYSQWGTQVYLINGGRCQVCFSLSEEYSIALGNNDFVLNENIKAVPRMRRINTEVVVTTTYLHYTVRQMQIPKSLPGNSDFGCKDFIQFLQNLCQKDSIVC